MWDCSLCFVAVDAGLDGCDEGSGCGEFRLGFFFGIMVMDCFSKIKGVGY